MKWKDLPSDALDVRLSEFMKSTKTDFVETRRRITSKSHILDNEFFTKLIQAFTRLAPNYIDQSTERTLRKWAQMKDEDIERELIELETEKGKEEFDRVWAFLYPDELKSRLNKLHFNNVIPKVRHIKLIRMLKNWESLSDDELAVEVKTELFGTGWNSSTSHFTFVKELYPNIDDAALKRRVDRILLSLMNPDKPVMDDMALYACSHLNVSGTVETYQELIRQAKQEKKV